MLYALMLLYVVLQENLSHPNTPAPAPSPSLSSIQEDSSSSWPGTPAPVSNQIKILFSLYLSTLLLLPSYCNSYSIVLTTMLFLALCVAVVMSGPATDSQANLNLTICCI